ncbi:hypothetical protein ALI144C_27520 [Actinosynnema sp. ALI-1.44]|nr:hypothetical protein ALI144C_27520 [Actinosynnema sp. ALI-1.44]
MSEEPGSVELGAVRGTYPTNNRRRGWFAMVLLSIGVPGTVFAVVFWLFVDYVSGMNPSTGVDPLLLPSVVVGLGVGMVLMGAWIGIWFLTCRGEVFELHDNGLRYSRIGRSQSIPWADVDRVVVRDGKNTALARWAGGDINCTVHLAGGGKLTITGLTENAGQLIGHVKAMTAR